jgi:3-ketosteroid 9alpha-monooxygenase subunit B
MSEPVSGSQRFTAFLENLKGRRELSRAYSMSSAPHERHLAVTVKEERDVSGVTKFPPLLSPMLVKRTVKDMRLVVTGFTGPYTLAPAPASGSNEVVHICAGSGSVPNFSMLKFALAHRPEQRHTFIYANKTWQDAIVHCLTRETDRSRFGPSVREGRIRLPLLRELIPEPRGCDVYVCGPGISKWDLAAAKEAGVEPQPRFLESSVI